MDFKAKYDPNKIEEKWYKFWLKNEFFKSVPNKKEPFTIVIPPPNVTGVLHMGHMLNCTIQDILVRRARMLGKNACWVPGTDHASIATEAKVVNQLNNLGINKDDITRDEFLVHAWKWTNKYGNIILEQLKKIGVSCDWDRTSFTLDEKLSKSVKKTFIDLYQKKLIYRGYRLVNWDPKAKTSISDEEVIHKDIDSKLYFIKYKFAKNSGYLTVATTRPETIFGDVAICLNPGDKRSKKLQGMSVIVPILNKKIPIIFDDYVDPDFGTGCLKITPAHDVNDKLIGDKHNLEIIDVLNEDGTLNNFGLHYNGMDRFKVRTKIANELFNLNLLEKTEDYVTKVGFSERTNEIIEPKLSVQWFLKMDSISKPALDSVLNKEVNLFPKKFINTYKYWIQNIHDWCISRQLWWGHQIPAYYYGKNINDFVVANSINEAYEIAKLKVKTKNFKKSDLVQDQDVLDTWFSSSIWPISVFDGINYPNNNEINYYYPTNDLVTAPEILFFWVIRMIIMGYEFKKDKPFKNVYLTGIVRDKKGRKMSKSLGNSPDPISLIEKYGADGVRVGMLFSSPAGNDLLFDESLCKQGLNFSNKIWNANKLIHSWESVRLSQPDHCKIAISWFDSKLNYAIGKANSNFKNYRISDVLILIYKLFWDDFCSFYLEIIKPFKSKKIDILTYSKTIYFFEQLLKLLHPFMPFISEEIWSRLTKRDSKNFLVISTWPKEKPYDNVILKNNEYTFKIISKIRSLRRDNKIKFIDAIELFVKVNNTDLNFHESILIKMCNIKKIKITNEKFEKSISFIINANEFFIPYYGEIDYKSEIDKLNNELKYFNGFLISIEKKLSNQNFISNAPESIIRSELKKKKDTLTKISVLKDQIDSINKEFKK